MNKKFSTLVASLLFASAFSAYAGTAASMFTAPTVVETRATANVSDINAVAPEADAAVKGLLLPKFTDNSRLLVFSYNTTNSNWDKAAVGTYLMYDGIGIHLAGYLEGGVAADAFYFNYANKQLETKGGLVLNLGGYSKFDVVPVSFKGKASNYFVLRAWAEDGTPVYINMTGSRSAGTQILVVDDIAKAALFVSAETAFATTPTTGAVLNDELKDGFNLSVTYGATTLKGAELFAGKLTAMNLNAGTFEAAMAQTAVYLKNKDGKYLVFDDALNASNAIKGGFKLVSEADAKALATAATAQFSVNAADNGSGAVQVMVDSKRLYVNVSNGTNVLTATTVATAPNANWAKTSLSATNLVDFKTLLTGKYVKISFVKKAESSTASDVAYKAKGILGLKYDANTKVVQSDYIKLSSVVAEDPATMWAPSIVGGDLILTNRENTDITVTIEALRNVSAGIYQIDAIGTANGLLADEQIKIEFVNSVAKTDGYMVEAENVLRNTTYYLGQSRHNADGDVPAYWAENHGTHQIGATVNKEEATQWNVELIKKVDEDYNTQIDSVLVVSSLYSYNTATGVTTEAPDTLAVLPYVFQNRGNREYVKINGETNLNYYICNKDNKDIPRNAQIFALKKKPGDTYNYFNLTTPTDYTDGNSDPVDAIEGAEKVYLKNSESKGTWENINAYSDDANSLMVVEKVDAPEYRKVVKEWGDTVKIFREEYPTEVLFEKLDKKSVVDKDTLSFLNVNNSINGANPALFIDTAYVNRMVGGVANTCYQYLLAVNVDKKNSVYCPYNPEHNTDAWRDEHNGPCADAKENPAVVKGRFLINLIDTAYAYKQDHLHNNPYINMVEADENLAKLSFVEGVHIKDTLYINRKGGEVVKLAMDSPAFNVAKFAFRYVDNKSGSFKIQTQSKNYDAETKKEFDESAHNNGYLRWVNGTIVVTNSYTNGETFNMDEEFAGNPVSNEDDITASSISVVATDGAVIIKGAQGKIVTISNILGQSLVNTAITSDNATISVPAGIVVVAVEGEAAVKAIVK